MSRSRHPSRFRPSDCALAALEALVRHGTYEKAAEALHLSPHTVRWHLGKVKQLLGANNLYEAIARATLCGWVLVGETRVAVVASAHEDHCQPTWEAAAPAAEPGAGDLAVDPLTACPDVRPLDDSLLRSLVQDTDRSRCFTYGYSA